jgi:hypothetical protein
MGRRALLRSAAARHQDADGRRPDQGESRIGFLCGGFQRLVGDLEGLEVFVALFGGLDSVVHFANPFCFAGIAACRQGPS